MVQIDSIRPMVRIFDPRFYLVCIFIYRPVRDPKSAVRSKADGPNFDLKQTIMVKADDHFSINLMYQSRRS